jgi:hypothetical protein
MRAQDQEHLAWLRTLMGTCQMPFNAIERHDSMFEGLMVLWQVRMKKIPGPEPKYQSDTGWMLGLQSSRERRVRAMNKWM